MDYFSNHIKDEKNMILIYIFLSNQQALFSFSESIILSQTINLEYSLSFSLGVD